jgi:hypothetical protein
MEYLVVIRNKKLQKGKNLWMPEERRKGTHPKDRGVEGRPARVVSVLIHFSLFTKKKRKQVSNPP